MPSSKVDDWFEALEEDKKPVLEQLRSLILGTAPGIVEELKWSRPCYSNEGGLFCYLYVTKKHSTLGFHKGTSLEDPAGLLEGTGKDLRHIKVRSLAGLDEIAVKALLSQAVSL